MVFYYTSNNMAKSSSLNFHFVVFSASICFFVVVARDAQPATAELPLIFVFGDSTVDVGTNNYLSSSAKANFPYNGIDYPNSVSTGRFSNGYNVADEIAKKMGYLESPTTYLGPPGRDLSIGVNFASAGAGIFKETGSQEYHVVVSFNEQIRQFFNVTYMMGGPKATGPKYSKGLFLISFGSNDLFDHMRFKSNLSDHDLVPALESQFRRQLKVLYYLGARRFGIIGVPPIGCCPYARAQLNNFGGGCVRKLDSFAKAFNHMAETLLRNLSSELKDMKYSFGDAYKMTKQLMKDPSKYGIKETRCACCGGGKFNGEVPCYSLMNPSLCSNRTQYLFWDMYHPTQSVAQHAAQALYNGDASTFVTPINFKQLLNA